MIRTFGEIKNEIISGDLGYLIRLFLIGILCGLVGFMLGRERSYAYTAEADAEELVDEKDVTDDLYALGMWHVDDYLENRVWSHDLSDGTTFGHRIHELQLNGHYSENLYRGPCNLSNAVELWNKSESHSRIMNNENNVNLILIMTPTEDGECFIVATYKE